MCRRRVPQLLAEDLLAVLVEVVEQLLRALLAGALQPEPGRELGEALVEPDIAPAVDADRVPEPLVPDLMGNRGKDGLPCEEWACLGLEGSRIVDVVIDDQTGRIERIRAEQVLLGADDRLELVERRLRRSDLTAVDEVPEGKVTPGAIGERALADVDRREIGRHRCAFLPAVDRARAVGLHAEKASVRHGNRASRDLEPEPVGRLVARMVAAGKPGRRPGRLGSDEGPIVGGDPTDLAEQRIVDRLRRAAVADIDTEALSPAERILWPDDQLLTAATEPRAATRHAKRLDPHPAEVEVEPAQPLLGDADDAGVTIEDVFGRIVGERQPVAVDLIPAVAGMGIEAVADPGRSDPGLGRLTAHRHDRCPDQHSRQHGRGRAAPQRLPHATHRRQYGHRIRGSRDFSRR